MFSSPNSGKMRAKFFCHDRMRLQDVSDTLMLSLSQGSALCLVHCGMKAADLLPPHFLFHVKLINEQI